jgi:catechol 2,3-dioxygenase-like lactoylglutathione lyase family enzyme
MQLNQVTIPVSDMDKACEFYLLLGFTQIVDTPHYARFACIEADPNNEVNTEPASFSLSLVNEKISHGATIYFEHQALDLWVSKLKDKGVKFEQEIQDKAYLWREAVLKDPSGNNIKLYWAGENRLNPPWRVSKSLD